MVTIIPTVRVKRKDDGVEAIINETDFDKSLHEALDEEPTASKDTGGSSETQADKGAGKGAEAPPALEMASAEQITAIVDTFKPDEPTHWIGSGLPNLDVIKSELAKTGFTTSRKDVSAATNEATRDTLFPPTDDGTNAGGDSGGSTGDNGDDGGANS